VIGRVTALDPDSFVVYIGQFCGGPIFVLGATSCVHQ